MIAVLLATTTACSTSATKNYDSHFSQDRDFHFDDNIPFAPHRLWRLVVHWEPAARDDSMAVVKKDFQFIAASEAERRKLSHFMEELGGETPYFTWLQSQLAPLGSCDQLSLHQIASLRDRTIVSLLYSSQEPVERKGSLKIERFWVPDPLLQRSAFGCSEGINPLIEAGENFGIEVILQGRDSNAIAQRWEYRERVIGNATIKTWSAGRHQGIAYRIWVQVNQGVASCPVPPDLTRELKFLLSDLATKTGVKW